MRTPEGDLIVSRTAPGRGAWLCSDRVECLDVAIKRKAFGRALKAPLTEGATEQLRRQLRSP